MNAYLFLWNPARDDQSFHDYDQVQSDAHAGKPYLTGWICPSTKPQPGDLAFLQRTGKENNGIFARGIVTSNPIKNDEGRRVVRLKLESFLPLNSEIKREALVAQSQYQYAWGPQASGTIIPPDLVNAITELWQVNHNLPINNPTRTRIGASALTEDRSPFAGRNIDATLLADSSVAEKTITGFLGDPSERLIALTQLIESADHANAVAPNAWGVTLHRNLFRLNVGRVEVLVVGEGTIRLNCVGRLGEPPFNGAEFESSNYRSVPDPQCTFVGPLAEFNAIKESIQRFHQKFIDRVGTKKSGSPVSGTPYRRSHAEGLLSYARNFITLFPSGGNVEEYWTAADESLPDTPLFEGARLQIQINAYERNTAARDRCIRHYGTACMICGFTSEGTYGEQFAGLIHVHHIRPISEIGEQYVIDPIQDLRPVCPNCHAVLHSRTPPYCLEEIAEILSAISLTETKDKNGGK